MAVKNARISANFAMLMSGIGTLIDLRDSTEDSTKEELKNVFNKLQKVGSEHDDCFADVKVSPLTAALITSSQGLVKLANKIEFIEQLCINYSRFTPEEIISELGFNVTNLDELQKMFIFYDFYDQNKSLYEKANHQELAELMKNGTYDYKYYSDILDALMNDSTKSMRQKAADAGIFLTTVYPHMKYFWGGGHGDSTTGVNSSWGTLKTVSAGGHQTSGTQQPYALDCSGFTSWAMRTAGYEAIGTPATGGFESVSKHINFGSPEVDSIEVGDVAHMNGHIGLIVDKQDNYIVVAHSAGVSSSNGMTLTKIDTNTGTVTENSADGIGTGRRLFTYLGKITYPDEVDK